MNTETDLHERRIGTTLRGKWKLERLLGVGGMAAVYVGVHKIGRRAAIKILHPDIAHNGELAARFDQEAHAVNSFRHPGTVEIIDVDITESGIPFLVMELLDGETLETRIQRQLIGVAETLRISDDLLDVLAAAHAHGIVHRDIKPDNLFLLRDGRLKVLDFGIARVRQGAPKSVYTQVGVAIGTLSYMPPEQVAGNEIDGRADLFAVGCTLFRLVTGRSPHDGDTEFELMVKMAMEPAPPLATVAPALPRELCMVVDRALAFDRERRYPDARTMQQDVRAVRAGRAPPFASARLAAGDVPNPPQAPAPTAPGGAGLSSAPAPTTPDGPRRSTTPAPPPTPLPPSLLATIPMPASRALMAMPPSIPVPASQATPASRASMAGPSSVVATMPMRAAAPITVGASSNVRTPTLSEMDGPPAIPSWGPSAAPAERARKTRDKVIALGVIGGTLAALGVAVAVWWSYSASAEDSAQAGAPARPPPAASRPSSPAVAPPSKPAGTPLDPVPVAPSTPPVGNAPPAANAPPRATALPFPTMPPLPPAPSLPPLPPLTLPTVTAPPPLQLPGPKLQKR